MAAVNVAKSPLKVPELAFQDAAGKPLTLEHWRGRTVLLNLWATWCVPCRKEMPALDALEQRLGGPGFEVVTINIDTRDPDKPKAWLKEVGVEKLAYYADPAAKTFQDLKAVGRAFGMPTTLLIDPQRLRDRHHRRPRRMGERRRGQTDSGGARKIVNVRLGRLGLTLSSARLYLTIWFTIQPADLDRTFAALADPTRRACWRA